MTQHTPGPWHCGEVNPHVVYDADQVMICNAGKPERARLLAAAPELLEALEYSLNNWKALRILQVSLPRNMQVQISESIKLAEEAIAKAEGLSHG